MTPDTVIRLRTEHANISGLLHIIERQLHSIADGKRPDYRLMYDILHYLTYHADRYHHPHEELLIERLAETRPVLSALAHTARREHRQIARDGTALRELIGSVIDGYLLPRDLLLERGRTYVQHYREHLQTTDNELLDTLSAVLADTVYANVSGQYWQPDSVFSESTSREFGHLRRHLASRGAGNWPWHDVMMRDCGACSNA